MYKLFILGCLILFSVSGNSQSNKVNIKNGPEFDPKGTIQDFIGQIGETIYVLSTQRNSYLGGVNANSLASQFTTELELPEYNNKKTTLRSVIILQDRVVMLCEIYDKNEDKRILFAQPLTDKGKTDGKYIILDEINAERKRNSGNFSYVVDSERGRILLFSNPPFEKYSNEKFDFKVLDKNLDIVWEQSLELPYPDRFFALENFTLDKNDNLFMICAFDDFAQNKEEGGKRKAKEEARNSGNTKTFKLLSYSHVQSKLKEFEIDLDGDKSILNFSYELDVDNNIYATGLYSENVHNKRYDGADGIFFVKLDGVSGKVKTVNTKPFEKEFIEEYLIAIMGERKGTKKAEKGEGIKNFTIRDLINRKDGGTTIVGEIYRFFTTTYTDSKGGTHTIYHYWYDYIMVISVNPEGGIDWMSYVPKIQHTQNDGGFYSSFAMITSEDELIFLYNDNLKNYNPKGKPGKVYPMTSAKKNVTAIATVDSEGKVKKEANVKLKAEKKVLRPKVYQYFAADQKLIVLGKLGKKESVVEITPK